MSLYSKQSPDSIRGLFDSIASRYDTGNSLMSFHLHRVWNHTLVQELAASPMPARVLDLCAGTGEISFRFLRYCQKHSFTIPEFVLLDFSQEMLRIAQKKVELLDTSLQSKFCILQGNALQLPFQEEAFDVVSIAYGIRNIPDTACSLHQVYKVLRPGGKVAILELTRPKNWFLRGAHSLYLHTVLPLIGKWTANNKEAYEYLCSSIHTFISPDELSSALMSTGFQEIQETRLSGGITTLIIARKGV